MFLIRSFNRKHICCCLSSKTLENILESVESSLFSNQKQQLMIQFTSPPTEQKNINKLHENCERVIHMNFSYKNIPSEGKVLLMLESSWAAETACSSRSICPESHLRRGSDIQAFSILNQLLSREGSSLHFSVSTDLLIQLDFNSQSPDSTHFSSI